MVDPTSDHNENVSEEDAPTCVSCGAPIVNNPNHRVLTWIEESEVQSAHFCDDDCRMAWDGNE
ncbi:MAG: hypothetical protein V5A55_07295 [Halovenus sp.]